MDVSCKLGGITGGWRPQPIWIVKKISAPVDGVRMDGSVGVTRVSDFYSSSLVSQTWGGGGGGGATKYDIGASECMSVYDIGSVFE